MSDYLLELEVKLNSNNVLDRFENQALSTGKKIEQTLSRAIRSGLTTDKLRLDIDTSGIKSATSEMKLLNREIAEAAKGMKAIGSVRVFRPSVGSSSSSSGGIPASSSNKASEAAAQRALNAELKRQQAELGLIAKLERDVASARLAGAKTSGNKGLVQTIALEKEALRHAQLLSKINASPLSPRAAAEARNLASALNSVNVNKIKSEFANLESQATKTFGKISNLAANVTGGVAGAITSAGLNVAGNVIGSSVNAVTGTLGDSASKAMDFNSTLNLIKIGTSSTAETMGVLRGAIMEASTAYGVAPTTMAAYALELSRMGVTAKGMPEALKAIGTSARSSGDDFDVVKNIINATNAVFSDLSSANVGDLLTVGANISPEGFQGIGQAISYVGSAAVDASVALPTLLEQLTILQTAGMRSDRAGTGLAALYTDIKENSGVIEELGVEVFDSSGKLRNMADIISEVGEKFKGMSDEQKALTLKPFDTNSVRVLLTLGQAYQNNAAKVKEYRDALAGASGEAARQSALAKEDPKAKLAQVEAQVDQLKIKLGEAFTPAIEGVLDFGGKLGTALLDNDAMFEGLNQSADEFKAYLEANPQLVTEMASALGEVGVILSQTILTETRDLLNYLQQNPQAIQQALDGMVEFAQNLASAVKMAADLAGALEKVSKIKIGEQEVDRGKIAEQKLMRSLGFSNYGDDSAGSATGSSGPAPEGLTAEGQKAYQLSQNPKVRALLDAITVGEGTSGKNGYNTMFGGGTFSDNSRHPAQIVSAGGYSSDAAGRYQFLSTTYNPVAQQLGLRDFSPQSQDIAATQLLINRGAIDPLMAGDRAGVQDRLAPEWASIPTSSGGSYYGQPTVSPGEFWSNYDRNLNSSPTTTASAPVAPPVPSLSDRADDFKVTVNGQTMTWAEYEQKRGEAVNAPVAAPSLPTTPFEGVQVTSAVDASGEPGLDYVVANGQRGAQFGSLTQGEVIETKTNQNWETDLNSNPGGQRGYGNQVIVRTIDEVTGEFVDILYAHLDNVAVEVGQTVGVGTILGTQGRTGSTTGAHVSADFFGKDSGQGTSASLAMRDRVARELASGGGSLNQQITAGGSSGNGLTRLDRALTPKERQAQRDEAEKKKQEAERQRLVQQARANEDQALQLQRQQEQSQRQQESEARRLAIQTSTAGLAGTPFEAVGQRQMGAFDLREKYQQEADSLRQEQQDLERELSRLDTRKDEPGIQAVVEGYKAAIAQTQSYRSALDERYQQESKLLEQTNAQAVAQNELAVRSEMAANRAARAQNTMALETEAFVSTIKDPTLQAFLRSGFDQAAKGNSYAEEIRKIEEEATKLEAAIKALEESGLDLSSPELQLTQEKLADLRDTMAELRSNADLELQVSVRGQTDLLNQFKAEQGSQLTQARVNVLQQRGDVFGANALQRTDAIQQQATSYFDQRSSIEALRGTAQENEIPGLMSNLEELNNFSLEGINNQFLTLNQTMAQTAQGALKGFLSDLGKGKGFAEAFTGALDNLAGSLFDLVLNQAFSSIFKGVGGGLGGSGSGGIEGIITQGLSGLAFSEGNVPNFASGSSPIDEAFRRERAAGDGKPYLAVFNDKEIILSAKQSERFMDLGLNKVVNMAGGNMPTANKAGVGAVTINLPAINLPPSDGNGQGSSDRLAEFAKDLQRQQMAVAEQAISKAQRPGGRLWNGGR